MCTGACGPSCCCPAALESTDVDVGAAVETVARFDYHLLRHSLTAAALARQFSSACALGCFWHARSKRIEVDMTVPIETTLHDSIAAF